MDISDFDLIPVTGVSLIKSKKEETLYDITVEGDHTFFIRLPFSEKDVLVHNCDGIHISAMLLGWWRRMAPGLFNEGKICRLNTPIVILKDKAGKIKDWFFEFSKFKEWESKNQNTNLNIIYLKGLGSLSTEDLDYIISKQGFESLLSVYKMDKDADKLFDIWLGSDAEARKNELKAYTMDINQI